MVSAITGHGGRAVAVCADVASEEDVEAMFGRAREQMGPLTALVNNAGAVGEQARIDERSRPRASGPTASRLGSSRRRCRVLTCET